MELPQNTAVSSILSQMGLCRKEGILIQIVGSIANELPPLIV